MDMGNLRRARMSPEIVGGQLRFYEGDQFSIEIQMELEDQDGTAVRLAGEDTVELVILDRTRMEVWRRSYTGLTRNAVTVEVDEELTGLLPKGKYSYRMTVTHGGGRTTIAADNAISVR